MICYQFQSFEFQSFSTPRCFQVLHPCQWSHPSGHGRSSCSFGIASWGSSSPTQYHASAIISTCIPMSRSSDYSSLHPKNGQRVVFMHSISSPSDHRRFVTSHPTKNHALTFKRSSRTHLLSYPIRPNASCQQLSPTHHLTCPSDRVHPRSGWWTLSPIRHRIPIPGNFCHLHPNVPSQQAPTSTHFPLLFQRRLTPQERLGRLVYTASRLSDRLQSTSQRRVPTTITVPAAATSAQRVADVPLDPSSWSWSLES